MLLRHTAAFHDHQLFYEGKVSCTEWMQVTVLQCVSLLKFQNAGGRMSMFPLLQIGCGLRRGSGLN